MTSTHFHADHGLLVRNRAVGYAPRDGGWAVSMSDWGQVGMAALTTVEDLARWVREFQDPEMGGRALVDELQRRGRLTGGEEIDYAEGLRHATFRGLATIGHNGSWAGYRSSLLRFPSEKAAMIVLCNAETAEAGTIARKIADVALADRLGPSAPASPEPSPTPRPKGRAIAPAELAALPGRYRSGELGADMEVAAGEGRLSLPIAIGTRPSSRSGRTSSRSRTPSDDRFVHARRRGTAHRSHPGLPLRRLPDAAPGPCPIDLR